jgi:hypothetical protein
VGEGTQLPRPDWVEGFSRGGVLHSAVRRFAVPVLFLLAPLHPAAADPVELHVRPVPLDTRAPEQTRVGRLEYLAGFDLIGLDRRWGGFSSMILTLGGDALLAVSDFGSWLQLELHHDADGRLTGVGAAEMGFLPGPDGKALDGKGSADAEGLTVGPDGGLLVSFEREHRVWLYDGAEPPFAAPPVSFPAPKAIVALPENSGIESLVTLAGAKLLALAEGDEDGDGDIPGWLWQEHHWYPLAWTRLRPFRPTDAAMLPDGDLIVLERRFSLAGGPGARLSVVEAGEVVPGAHLFGTPIAELKLPHSVDNFEGIAARPGPGGDALIYLLSDDNRSELQRTLLLQFRWER